MKRVALLLCLFGLAGCSFQKLEAKAWANDLEASLRLFVDIRDAERKAISDYTEAVNELTTLLMKAKTEDFSDADIAIAFTRDLKSALKNIEDSRKSVTETANLSHRGFKEILDSTLGLIKAIQ